jgi:hypothetical protein
MSAADVGRDDADLGRLVADRRKRATGVALTFGKPVEGLIQVKAIKASVGPTLICRPIEIQDLFSR